MIPGEKPETPIWMALVPVDPKMRQFFMVTVISIAPVAIAILMQKPQLRQAIAMRTLHTSKEMCQDMADMFQTLANHSATAYQKVQL